ncbi:MAG: hypothetical protein H7831_04645 [Magnetococcus sp. WYHC-3]
MKPSSVVSACAAVLEKSPKAVFFLKGKPGIGKSELCLQIGARLGIPDTRTLVVHVNNHEVVDFTGVPRITDDGTTKFAPTDMFYQFRSGTGPGLIVLEAFSHRPVDKGIETQLKSNDDPLDQIRQHERTGRPLGDQTFLDTLEKRLGRLLIPQ